MKYGFWQIQIKEEDRYKTAFTVPFGQYEWNVMPFGLKNAPSEFQRIMNDIFNPLSKFTIVYIDDVFVDKKDLLNRLNIVYTDDVFGIFFFDLDLPKSIFHIKFREYSSIV